MRQRKRNSRSRRLLLLLSLQQNLKKKLLKVVSEVCLEKSLDYVIDTGKGTYLYINESKGVDITEQVFRQLGIDVHEESVTEGNLPVIVQEDKK
jgi:Skp family chaperone for outer membrane proteins